jgi:hypothetical protein
MANARLAWVATVSGEGGPLMVVDLPDLAQWTGAAPYLTLRQANPKYAESTKDRMRTLHYWGQFTAQLPAPFGAEGGHQYVSCDSEAAARARLEELVAAVKSALPTVEVTEGEEQTHFLLPGDDRDLELWAELAPKSEYDASWQSNVDEDCWLHSFGKSGKSLFWEIEGGGVADLGISKGRDELVLVRSWVNDEADEEAVHALVDAPDPREQRVAEFTVATGKAVILWSPIAPFMLEGISSPEDLARLGETDTPDELQTEDMGGIGAVIRIKPGRYAVSVASTDDSASDEDKDEEDAEDGEDGESSWSARWCRLTWLG